MEVHEHTEKVDVAKSVSAGRLVRNIGAWRDDLIAPMFLLAMSMGCMFVFFERYHSPGDGPLLGVAFVMILLSLLLVRSICSQLRLTRLEGVRGSLEAREVIATFYDLGWSIFESDGKEIVRAMCTGWSGFSDKVVTVIIHSPTVLINVRNRSTGRGVRLPLNVGGLRRVRLLLESTLRARAAAADPPRYPYR